MILVTVGTQLPFDRLLSVMDAWAGTQDEPVIGQVGPSKLRFRHINASPFVSSGEMDDLFARARVVVAHAGMGSILSALRFRKPIIIVPRKASLGEHRNEHQLATARWMQARTGVTVAWEPEQAIELLNLSHTKPVDATLSPHAPIEFIKALRAWINADV